MHKKKMKSVLKGVLVAGTAVGGAAVMTEADVVYAAENEYLPEEEIVLPLEDETEEEVSMLTSLSVSAAESTVLSTEASNSASEQLISNSESAASESERLSVSASQSAELSASISTSEADSSRSASQSAAEESVCLRRGFCIRFGECFPGTGGRQSDGQHCIRFPEYGGIREHEPVCVRIRVKEYFHIRGQ